MPDDDSGQPATGYPTHPYPPPQPSAADGYFQQPPIAYAFPAHPQPQPNPYIYNNNYPPPQQRVYYLNPDRGAFLRRVIIAMIATFTIIIVISFIIWAVLRPKLPEFRVDSASVTGFNLSGSVSGNWDFRITVSNPNKKFNVVFEGIDSELAYGPFSIADNSLAPFKLTKRNASTIGALFTAREEYMSDVAVSAMSKDRSDDGVLGFDVLVYSWVVFDAGDWKVKRRLLRVLCDDVKIAIGSSGDGNMSGEARNCIVRW